MSLTEFLLARIDEVARTADEIHHEDCEHLPPAPTFPCDCGQPAHVLAQCAVDRRIVEEAQQSQASLESRKAPATDAINGHVIARRRVVRQLASVYADHPDYREEWRP